MERNLTRFWDKVRKGDSCWEWTHGRTASGYGGFWHEGTTVRAHRFAWTITHGQIPNGMHVLHHCDNPSCVRPDHLFLGTTQDNCDDMRKKGRGKYPGTSHKGEDNKGARLTSAQVTEIRRLRDCGALYKDLAKEFGVSFVAVSRICRGVSWGHMNWTPRRTGRANAWPSNATTHLQETAQCL